MFEKFGLKDIFVGLWRYKLHIVVSTLVLTVIMSGFLYKTTEKSKVGSANAKIYSSSATFYFEPKDTGLFDEANQIQSNIVTPKELATTYNTILDADFCKQYVLDYLQQYYTIDELKSTLKVSDYTLHTSAGYFKHALMKDEKCVNIYTVSTDETYSKRLLEAYKSYIENVTETQMMNTTAVYLGGTDQILPANSNSEIVSKSYTDFSAKSVIMIAAIIFVMGCIVVFFKCLFVPTLNRAEDFARYDIPVLGEVSGKGKEA